MKHEIESTLGISSISFLVAFRELDNNDLTGLSADVFDSLASLSELYVLSLVVETSFVSCLVQLDTFFFLHPGPV